MFFIPFDNWKLLFLVKVCGYLEILPAAMLWLSFKQVFWKNLYFLRYLHNITAVVKLKFQNNIILNFTG